MSDRFNCACRRGGNRGAEWGAKVCLDSEPLQSFEVPGDQRFLLRPRPPFDLPLTSKCAHPVRILLRIDHRNRATAGGEARRGTLLVSLQSEAEVVCLANVECAVSAAENVDEVHSTTTMTSSSLAGQR